MTGHPKSRWLFLTLALMTASGCVALGCWQLRRLAERRAINAAASARRSEGRRALVDTLTLRGDLPVLATGEFDLEHEFVLRGRAHDGAPGVEVATPFRVSGEQRAYLVVRGFVPSDDATSVDLAPLRESGVRTIHGVLFKVPVTSDSGAPLLRKGAVTWSRLDSAAVSRLPYPVAGFALWQEKDSQTSAIPIRLGAPALSDGPHLNYALQWFAFAIIFGGGGVVFAFRRNQEKDPPLG